MKKNFSAAPLLARLNDGGFSMSSSTVAAAMIVMMSFTAGPAFAQKPSPEGGQPQQKEKEKPPAPMTGELVAVDESAKTLTIKTASEGEVKFSCSDKTEI